MLILAVNNLKEGVHDFTMNPSAEDLDLEAARFHDIEVRFRLDRREDRILVHFDVAAQATLECDRTLVLFEEPVSGSYSVLFAPEALGAGLDADDVFPFVPTQPHIDVTTPVRDTLLLALPTRRVAPGAEQLDLPSRFGQSEAGDPRWEALRHLRTSGDAGEEA